jgi:hypothetical protein
VGYDKRPRAPFYWPRGPIGPGEKDMQLALHKRGYDFTHQKSIGRWRVDLAGHGLVIEIENPSTTRSYVCRNVRLYDIAQEWHVLYIFTPRPFWTDQHKRAIEDGADYAVTHLMAMHSGMEVPRAVAIATHARGGELREVDRWNPSDPKDVPWEAWAALAEHKRRQIPSHDGWNPDPPWRRKKTE